MPVFTKSSTELRRGGAEDPSHIVSFPACRSRRPGKSLAEVVPEEDSVST